VTLFRMTLRDLRWQIVGYGVGLGAVAALYVVVYPAFADTFADFEFPEAYSAFLGASDISDPRNFFQIEFFSFWMPLLLAIYALIASTAQFAGDEQKGTLEMVLAQPLSRRSLFVQRAAGLAVAAVLICALGALGFAVSAPFVRLGDVALRELVVATLNLAPLMLACAGLGLVVATVSPTRGVAAGLVALETFVVYFANTLSSLADWLEPLRYLSLFFCADVSVALSDGIEAGHAAVLLGAFALLTALAVRAFEVRELDTVRWQLRALLGRELQAPS